MPAPSVQSDFEPMIWGRLLEAQAGAQREISPDVARFLLAMGFGEQDHARIQDLAERSQAGSLTPEEAAEFDSYLHVGNLLTMMKSKARATLGLPQAKPRAL